MSAAEYELGGARASARGAADEEYRAARWRLTLAVLWLAGLVSWGVLSYATADMAESPRTSTSAQDEVTLGSRVE